MSTLLALEENGRWPRSVVTQAIKDLNVNPEKVFPVCVQAAFLTGLGEARIGGPLVAQISNLLPQVRDRIVFGRASATRSACGLEIRETAD